MTTIRYNEQDLCMEISGHAGAAAPGHDIVCAAATILMRTLEAAVMEKQSGYVPSVRQRDGYAKISCVPKPKYRAKCKEVFDTIYLGYELLAANYPQYVRANQIEED